MAISSEQILLSIMLLGCLFQIALSKVEKCHCRGEVSNLETRVNSVTDTTRKWGDAIFKLAEEIVRLRATSETCHCEEEISRLETKVAELEATSMTQNDKLEELQGRYEALTSNLVILEQMLHAH